MPARRTAAGALPSSVTTSPPGCSDPLRPSGSGLTLAAVARRCSAACRRLLLLALLLGLLLLLLPGRALCTVCAFFLLRTGKNACRPSSMMLRSYI